MKLRGNNAFSIPYTRLNTFFLASLTAEAAVTVYNAAAGKLPSGIILFTGLLHRDLLERTSRILATGYGSFFHADVAL